MDISLDLKTARRADDVARDGEDSMLHEELATVATRRQNSPKIFASPRPAKALTRQGLLYPEVESAQPQCLSASCRSSLAPAF
jgi:hypothetical protein